VHWHWVRFSSGGEEDIAREFGKFLDEPAERSFYRPKTTFSRVKRRAVIHTHSRPSTSNERYIVQ